MINLTVTRAICLRLRPPGERERERGEEKREGFKYRLKKKFQKGTAEIKVQTKYCEGVYYIFTQRF